MAKPSLHSRFVRWLSSLHSRQYSASRPGRARPMLEHLEERLTPTFGTNGTSFAQFFEHTNSVANGAVVQPDGKVVAVGSAGTGFIVTRYNADGRPDTSFGPHHNGQVLSAFTEPAAATAVALQGDGRIVVAGYTQDPTSLNWDFALARYNTDGSLDTSFGTGGGVTTSFGAFGSSASNVAKSIVIDSAGRIVLGGYTADVYRGNSLFALARYTVNGSLDKTFGSGGRVVTNFGGSNDSAIDAVALDAKGRLVAAGHTAAGMDDTGNQATRFALARYTTNGSLDKTFGTGGEATTNVSAGNDDEAHGLAIQPDGKIVAAGSTYNPDKRRMDFALVRYTISGSLDRAFGTGGMVATDFGGNGVSAINAVTTDAQGRIVAAGYTVPGYTPDPYFDTAIFALARYTSGGSLDTTFGTGGEVSTRFPSGSVVARGIARGPNGQLLLVGGGPLDLNLGTPGDFALARYNANGSLDQSFGTLGQISTAFTERLNSTLNVIAAQPDGKLIVVGGIFNNDGIPRILRLNKDGSLDTTFGNGGEVVTPLSLTSPADHVAEVVVQPDGKILVVVSYAPLGSQDDGFVSLLRFNADGSLDTSFGKGGQTRQIELPGQQNGAVVSNALAGAIVQPDGKIVVAAGAWSLDLVRLNKDGSIDTSFGSGHNGSVMTAFTGYGTNPLALQPDGKIVLTGTVSGVLALTRFNADGSADKTFGSAGVVHTTLVANGIAGVVLQQGGKIVVGGNGGTQNDFFLMRFNTNGSLDKTFGTGGQAFTDFGGDGTARSIVIDSAGRIVLAGYSANFRPNPHIYVARYSANGQLDTHFGGRGRLIAYFTDFNSLFSNGGGGTALMLQPQGALVVAGTKFLTAANSVVIGLTEYAT
jgi:uncharacterized delta-60 repeat protein